MILIDLGRTGDIVDFDDRWDGKDFPNTERKEEQ